MRLMRVGGGGWLGGGGGDSSGMAGGTCASTTTCPGRDWPFMLPMLHGCWARNPVHSKKKKL